MKRLPYFILSLLAVTSSRAATLNYNLGDYTLNPTNVLFSNLVSTAQITWSMGASGRITGTITFPTVFDENWTNANTILHPITAPTVAVSNLLVGTLLVTNQSTFLGLVTNHQTLRGTNIFDGGWMRVVGNETNDAGVVLSARTASSILRTDGNKAIAEVTVGTGLSFDGTTLSDSVTSIETNLDNLTVTNTANFLSTANVGGTLTADATRITNGLTVGGAAAVSSLNVTNALNAAGTVGASILRVTNESTFLGLVTNHSTMRGTNFFNGGWSEVVGPQTNRADLYGAGGVFVDNARITNGLNVSGTISGNAAQITNGLTVAGTAGIATLRVTNNATVGGSVSADSATVTNALNAGSANVGGALNVSSVRVTNNVTVGGSVSSDSLNVTNGLNASGTIGASILRVTNETTHLGLMTNHSTSRMTNIFDGGWLEVVGPQTNRDKVDIAGKVTASILQVTNEVTMFGLQTNHQTLRVTNVFNGGWNRIQSPSTNETTHWGTNIFDGGFMHVTGNQTNAGFVRATNGLVVPSAGGLALGTGATITNILSASAALTFTAVGAQRYVDASITVTGTTTNDACFLGVPFQVQQGVGGTNLIFSPFTSNDTVWVRCNNYGTATRSTNGVFNVLVFKR